MTYNACVTSTGAFAELFDASMQWHMMAWNACVISTHSFDSMACLIFLGSVLVKLLQFFSVWSSCFNFVRYGLVRFLEIAFKRTNPRRDMLE